MNLLNQSSGFVMRVSSDSERATIASVNKVPSLNREDWVAGKTELKSGLPVESLFRVDTGSAGTQIGVFWKIKGSWWNLQNRPEVFSALEISQDEAFPFKWTYFVPLEHNIFGS